MTDIDITQPQQVGEPTNFQAQLVLEDFLMNDLAAASAYLADPNNETSLWAYFVWCDRKTCKEFSRRLMVLSDAGSMLVRVCVEAAYQVFDGDTAYHVERVGTILRTEVETELTPLIRKAYERMLQWQPTHDNIWDFVQL